MIRVPIVPAGGLLPALLLCLVASRAPADERLVGTPMVAWTEMRAAAVWVETRNPQRLMLAYWPFGDPDRMRESRPVETGPAAPYTATLVADRVEPGQTYEYAILIDGEPALLTLPTRFSTLPDYRDRQPPGEATFALLAGHYVNEPAYDPPYARPGADAGPVAAALGRIDPDACIWIGDTLYLRPADHGSTTGLTARYRHSRARSGLAAVLASRPQYAIWGREESGWADAGPAYLLRNEAARLFREYWPARNARPAAPGLGMATRFRWWDADFFLLDAFSHRTARTRSRLEQALLGEAQVDWLLDALATSDARFKIVVLASPALNPVTDPRHWSYAEKERAQFMEALDALDLPGLLFLSGGIGYGELTRQVRARGYDQYEFTVGPVTGPTGEDNETLNYFREPGTAVFEPQFGTLSLSGPETNRSLTLRSHRPDGSVRWERIIEAVDLGY